MDYLCVKTCGARVVSERLVMHAGSIFESKSFTLELLRVATTTSPRGRGAIFASGGTDR